MNGITAYASGTRDGIGQQAAAPRGRAYRPEVDGLRSIAILSVVLYHAGVRHLSGGFSGVDIFFVISGYLIGGHINSELASGAFRFSHFYRNRAKRILPALYVVLAGVLIAGLVLFSPRELRNLAMYLFATTASGSNIALWRTTGYFAPNADQNPLLMTWSLGVEEQFYLVIPVLLVLLARIRHRLILPLVLLISAASFAAACYQVKHSPDAAFYLLPSRAWELGIGVALAMFEAEPRQPPALQTKLALNLRGWLGLGLVTAPLFLLTPSTPFPGPAAVPSVIGAALLLSASGAWANRRLLSLAPLVFVGRVSYSFYLVHWPLLAFLRVLRGETLPESWGLIAIAVAFGLAVLSYFFVETPFRSSKRASGPLLIRYGAVSLLLLLVSGAIFKSKGLPWRYPRAAAVDEIASEAINADHAPCLAQIGESVPRLSPVCTGSQAPLDRTPSRQIALWGDSHASAVADALRSKAARQGYFMQEYAKTACPPLSGTGRYYRASPDLLGECIRFNAVVLQRLAADPKVKAVVLDAFWDAPFDPRSDSGKLRTAASLDDRTRVPSQSESEALLGSSLRETVIALVNSGKQVIVLGDTPVFAMDPVWRMRTEAIPLRRKIAAALMGGSTSPGHGADRAMDPGTDRAFDDTPPQLAEQTLLRQTAQSMPGVAFWEMRSHLCGPDDLCVYRQNNDPLYVDTNHLSTKGAELALQGLQLPAPRAPDGAAGNPQ